MNSDIWVAVVACVAAILGSVVTGWFTLTASSSQKDLQRFKKQLVKAYEDIAAFHRLEEKYTARLADESKSADAWKREIRRELRSDGFNSPSEEATTARAEFKIQELT